MTAAYASVILYGLNMYGDDGTEDHPPILYNIGVPASVSFFFVSVSFIAGGLSPFTVAASLALVKPARVLTRGE